MPASLRLFHARPGRRLRRLSTFAALERPARRLRLRASVRHVNVSIGPWPSGLYFALVQTPRGMAAAPFVLRPSGRGLPGGGPRSPRPSARSASDAWLPSCATSPHWPYVVLGAGYGCLDHDSISRLSFRLVAMFTAGGVLLALTTVVLVVG